VQTFNSSAFTQRLAQLTQTSAESIVLDVMPGSVLVTAIFKERDAAGQEMVKAALEDEISALSTALGVELLTQPSIMVPEVVATLETPPPSPMRSAPPTNDPADAPLTGTQSSALRTEDSGSNLAMMAFVLAIGTMGLTAVAALAYVIHRRKKARPRAQREFGMPVQTQKKSALDGVDLDDPVAVREASEAASRNMLRLHLRDYVRANGPNASFKAWIATLHPENVQLDSRMWFDDSEQLALWQELTGKQPERPRERRADAAQAPQLRPRQEASGRAPPGFMPGPQARSRSMSSADNRRACESEVAGVDWDGLGDTWGEGSSISHTHTFLPRQGARASATSSTHHQDHPLSCRSTIAVMASPSRDQSDQSSESQHSVFVEDEHPYQPSLPLADDQLAAHALNVHQEDPDSDLEDIAPTDLDTLEFRRRETAVSSVSESQPRADAYEESMQYL